MAVAAIIDTSSQNINSFSGKSFPAANLGPEQRKDLAIEVLARTQPVSQLADKHGVSRKFLYQQAEKATNALDEVFNTESKEKEKEVLFYIPVTKQWLKQFIIALVLVCHSSYRGVIEFLRDILDVAISIGTIHNTVYSVVGSAKEINSKQDLSPIRNGAHDELFQTGNPVLVGVDLYSTYCYLLAVEQQRDGDTWAIHLLDLIAQGFNPDHIIADGGKGLRAGQKSALPDAGFIGDVFHPLYELGKLVSSLDKRALSTISTVEKLQQDMSKAKKRNRGNTLSKKLACARTEEEKAVSVASDISILADWIKNDILSLSGPSLAERRQLFDFVTSELLARQHLCPHRIAPVRRALENQRDDLLAFAGLLDQQFELIAKQTGSPIALLYDICQLQALSQNSPQYHKREAELRAQLHSQFYGIQQLVRYAMESTPHASSIVENFNSRLRNYFFLRRHLGVDYLDLLRFFLNHRTFMRSERPERVGKSPTELLTGQRHAHWLELLGFERFRRN